MDATVVGLISAATAVAGGIATKAFDSWLGARSKITEELRKDREPSYRMVWERTEVVSTWPRTDATYADLERLHRYLRSWYYTVGGLYLSENARARYGDVQELIGAHLDYPLGELEEDLPPGAYKDIMETCSAFRTSLTEDLESRRQRSLVWTMQRWRLHRRQRRKARRRLAKMPAPASSSASGWDRLRKRVFRRPAYEPQFRVDAKLERPVPDVAALPTPRTRARTP